MSMKTLIKDLASIDRMLFVVGGGACVSEMYSDGKTEPQFHDRWGMIESGPWHLHLDMSSIKQAQFVEAENHGAPMLYYVRFSDAVRRDPRPRLLPQPLSKRRGGADGVPAGQAGGFRGDTGPARERRRRGLRQAPQEAPNRRTSLTRQPPCRTRLRAVPALNHSICDSFSVCWSIQRLRRTVGVVQGAVHRLARR